MYVRVPPPLFSMPQLVDDVAERETALVGGGEGKEPVRYRWDEGGFYAVLTGRVKRHFLEKHGQRGLDPRKASVNRFVKVCYHTSTGYLVYILYRVAL